MTDKSEAFSRILIDDELTYSGWDLHDPHQLRFEYHTHNGRADYLLMDKNGGVCGRVVMSRLHWRAVPVLQ